MGLKMTVQTDGSVAVSLWFGRRAAGAARSRGTVMDPLYLLIVWTIAAIVLIGIASAMDVIIASRLGYPRRRRVFVALISFLVLSVGFLAIMLLLLHWAAPSTL